MLRLAKPAPIDELDWLDRGLTEMLTTNLAQVQGLDVLSTERIQGSLQRLGKKDSGAMNPGLAQAVARDASADAFVTGALLKVGPTQVRLDVRVQDTQTGKVLESEKLEGESVQNIFAHWYAVPRFRFSFQPL